jgi:chromosome segregation ATPase
MVMLINIVEHHQVELENISKILKQVDLYNEEIRSKILVAKRTTLKAEKDILKQEIEKKRQDYFIDSLTEKLRTLQEKRSTYDAQLMIQQRETEATNTTLHEAATEMEAIQYEKRQLLHQWKSSLIGLEKREGMLAEIEAAIGKNNEDLAIIKTEIIGFQRILRRSQEEGENLTGLLNKLDNEQEFVKRQISSIAEQREKTNEGYSVLTKSLTQTERELSLYQQERLAVQQEINAINKASTANINAIHKIEKSIEDNLELQNAYQKGTQVSTKDRKKLRNNIRENEIAIANYQNEISLVKLETLNCESRILGSEDQLRKTNLDLDKKNALIAQYEQEIRKNNEQLAKKASEMDLLNKKYDLLTGGTEVFCFITKGAKYGSFRGYYL